MFQNLMAAGPAGWVEPQQGVALYRWAEVPAPHGRYRLEMLDWNINDYRHALQFVILLEEHTPCEPEG